MTDSNGRPDHIEDALVTLGKVIGLDGPIVKIKFMLI